MLNKLFRKKKQEAEAGKSAALRKAEEIPYAVGRDLVVLFKQEPDIVWKLMAVARPKQDSPDLREFRVFSPQQAAHLGVQVKNFTTLDEHPNLIFYHGWYNKKAMRPRSWSSQQKADWPVDSWPQQWKSLCSTGVHDVP